VFIELIKGVALLLALCLLYGFILRRWRNDELPGLVLAGILFGGICIIGMMAPLRFPDGVIFDARSVILAMAGFFGGPVVGILAGIIAACYRLWLGGGGAVVGVAVIVTCVGLGLVYHLLYRRRLFGQGFNQYLVFGFFVHVLSFLWFTLLPVSNLSEMLQVMVAPYIGVFTLATAFLGWLLQDARRSVAVESRLSEKSKQLDAVMNYMTDGISVVDSDLNVVIYNKRFLELLEFPPDQLKFGDPFEKFVRYNAMRGEYGDGDIETLVRTRVELARKFEPHSMVRERPNGLSIAVKGNPLPGGGMVSLYSDITQQLKERRALEQAKQEAEQASASKSQFLSHMSHELRTPLNSIIGFSEVMHCQLYGKIDNAKYLEYLLDIRRSGEHLLQLINDVLDLSKIDAGQVVLNEIDIDMERLIDECVRMVGGRQDRNPVHIRVEKNGTHRLRADDRIVKQVILNLLTNAVKYNVPGGQVTILVQEKNDALSLVVRDTGIGIAPADIPKVLEPFGQVRSDAYRTHEGTGLGLSLSKQLTELHGGSLSLESTVGIGTAVTVRFPPERTIH